MVVFVLACFFRIALERQSAARQSKQEHCQKMMIMIDFNFKLTRNNFNGSSGKA